VVSGLFRILVFVLRIFGRKFVLQGEFAPEAAEVLGTKGLGNSESHKWHE
jgi:hypothetical protein